MTGKTHRFLAGNSLDFEKLGQERPWDEHAEEVTLEL